MKRLLYACAGGGVVTLLLLLAPLTASAHERRDVGDGQYRMVVGFLDEPAFAGEKNGLSLAVSKLGVPSGTPAAGAAEGEGTPVEGLFDTLTAEVIYGDQTMELELEPVFNEPGAYGSIFFPTAEGDYSFHIVGDIEGVAIDETFTPGPETFSSVESTEPYQFPKEESSNTGNASAMIGGEVGGASGGSGSPLALLGVAAVLVAALTVGRWARHRQPSSLLPVRS